MGDIQETCNTGLGLGIGMGEFMPKFDRPKKKQVVCLDLSFPLQPKEEIIDAKCTIEGSSSKTTDVHKISLANNNCNSNNNNDSNNKSYSRKKLRLSKEQSTLLEESFKLHSTLNPTQKQTLAEKLNLRPRQVEVWFQNRRARTKLKQTEVDCEFLKRCCESLSDENRRLKKELQEMRSLKFEQPPPPPPPLYIQFPKAAKLAAICRNCEKIVKADGDTTRTNNTTAKNNKTAAAAAAVAMDVVHKPNIKKQSFLDGPS